MVAVTSQRSARTTRLSTALVALVAASVGCSGSGDGSPSSLVDATAGVSAPVDTDTVGDTTGSSESATDASPASGTAPTYTVVAGDTISGIASAAGVTADDLVAANGWPDGVNHLILPGDVISLPPGSSAVPAPTTASGAPPSTAAANSPATTSGGYQTTSPSLGFTNNRTAAVTEPLADGVYFAQSISASGGNVAFGLGQLFLCTGEPIADQPGLDCAGQTTVQLNQPSAQIQLASSATVVLISGGTGSPVNFSVTTPEYARLVNGLTPSSDAPAGFQFGGDRTLVRVSGGTVVTVEQIYTS